jgi:hypothetical protein
MATLYVNFPWWTAKLLRILFCRFISPRSCFTRQILFPISLFSLHTYVLQECCFTSRSKLHFLDFSSLFQEYNCVFAYFCRDSASYPGFKIHCFKCSVSCPGFVFSILAVSFVTLLSFLYISSAFHSLFQARPQLHFLGFAFIIARFRSLWVYVHSLSSTVSFMSLCKEKS